jgi:hypothetical protein
MIPTRGNAYASYEQRSVGVFEEVQGNASTGVCSYFHHTSASMCKCCVGFGLLFSFLAFALHACVWGSSSISGDSVAECCCMINYHGQLTSGLCKVLRV